MATRLEIEPQKLVGFAPDLDPSTPGIFQTCNNVVPTLIGFKSAASPVTAGLPALTQPAQGSALISRLDGTDRQYAGTQNHLFENTGGVWVDQSRSGGYSIGGGNQWRFAAFGNESLAVNGVDVLQASLDGAFSNVPVALQTITVPEGGTGYTSPTVTISAPDLLTGIQATATATVSGGVVTDITITNAGTGYYNTPTVTISDAAGTGAKATAQLVAAPVGKTIFVANGQVFVCNCSSPPEVAGGNFWFASGIYDQTQWDYTNEQTLCAYGQLIDTPGPITAGTSLGPNAILFKSNSMFIGTQTGYPVGWDFQAVSKNIGTFCQESVVNTGTTLFFIGPDDFYAYQGNGLPVPIGQNVRRWFFDTLSPNYKTSISSFYDQEQRVIYWAFVSNASSDGTLDTCITYNWSTGTWGRMDTNMQGFVQVISGQITYNELGVLYQEWEDLPTVSWDSSFWINFRVTPGYFDSTNTLRALAGASSGATITTNAFGDDLFYSSMQQFKMRFFKEPAAGSALWLGSTALGEASASPTVINTGPFIAGDARIDVDQNARWHTLQLTFTGDFEILQWYPMMVQRGKN
ncbi:hypothetical protein AB4Y36_03460 [Paraburkholderia sp. BR10936]|uniref:hypothetical protein n=1 Tax=Paraburkholderia sp. BR10936 TaxID=3236993 RepID=UPI0034D206A8